MSILLKPYCNRNILQKNMQWSLLSWANKKKCMAGTYLCWAFSECVVGAQHRQVLLYLQKLHGTTTSRFIDESNFQDKVWSSIPGRTMPPANACCHSIICKIRWEVRISRLYQFILNIYWKINQPVTTKHLKWKMHIYFQRLTSLSRIFL